LILYRFYTQSQETLCVHAKKREEVENALSLALEGKLKIVVLVGPTGSAKTACIEVICRHDCD
jgi:ABC-type Mn2+/Zn2+ transport system ATPase subunit